MTLSFQEQLKLEEKQDQRAMQDAGIEFRTAFDIWEEKHGTRRENRE